GSVMTRLLGLALGLGALAATLLRADEPRLPAAKTVGKLEVVATFTGPMPTGVTVSRSGRVFVNYPRWGDPVEFTVAEVKDGRAGVAYITDSSGEGPNGIVVVDLDTGASRRRLHDHPSTKAEKNFQPVVEGRPLLERKPGQPPKHLTLGSDGIAIGHDGKHL